LLAYTLTIPMMLSLNWKLAVVTFLLYPIVIVFMGKISKKVRQGFYDVQTVLGEISTVAQENLNGMMVIQSYVREAQENQRFQKVCDAYFGAYTRLIHERILLFMLLAGLSGISTGLVLLVGGWQVIEKQLDWGGFVAFTMYLEHLAWPTMALGWTISIFQQGTAALQRLDEVFSAQSNIQDGTEPASTLSPVRGEIEIRNLTFAYQNPYAKTSETETPEESVTDAPQDSHPVLQDVNLSIRPGETVALVGSVGSGKSTLLRLLPRTLEVPENTVFLDGQDITCLPLEVLRANLVFMPQASFLFSTSVQQNIAFGQPELLEGNGKGPHPAELPSIVQAAETASVHLDIQGLPQQYQTLVGERGLMLSGGQRQRVALARAILLDAKVLVLDDPVSNVDAETERNIVSALRARKVFSDKTTLLATHRFSLVSLCDRVVLMDAGKILAVGTHAELLATQPLYQNLNRLQELRASLGDWGLEPETSAEKPADVLADEDEALAELLENTTEGAAS
jgi:ATP-binding cassette subfamily B protein